MYTCGMEIEKIHKDYSDMIINYENRIAMWEKMYHQQRRTAAKLREALNRINNDQGERQMFDGFTYKEYKLVERIADLQDELAECRAKVDLEM